MKSHLNPEISDRNEILQRNLHFIMILNAKKNFQVNSQIKLFLFSPVIKIPFSLRAIQHEINEII